jgi:hypothetical protein
MNEGDSKAATLSDGTRLGKVSKVRGRETVQVVDEKAFTAWVTATYPTEIETNVRPAFREKVMSSAKAHGMAVDGKTGELIPGIEIACGSPYISYRSDKGSAEVIATRWQELAGPAFLLAGE